MTRQLEQDSEDKVIRRAIKVTALLDGGLAASIERSGGILLGFSAKNGSVDCLLTLRVSLAGRKQVAFVGSETLGGALLKANDLAKRDKLKYKADRYA